MIRDDKVVCDICEKTIQQPFYFIQKCKCEVEKGLQELEGFEDVDDEYIFGYPIKYFHSCPKCLPKNIIESIDNKKDDYVSHNCDICNDEIKNKDIFYTIEKVENNIQKNSIMICKKEIEGLTTLQ